jgi:hypothetical protein
LAEFIAKLIGILLRALIEDFLLWPFMRGGKSFAVWWSERSIGGKFVAVLILAFWIVLLAGVIGVVVQQLRD